jgi:ABC-type transport system substrate-binding protein
MIAQVYTTPFDFDLAVTGNSGFVDPSQLLTDGFKTGGSGNFSGYSNPDVDKLLDQAIVETDQPSGPSSTAGPGDPVDGPALG